MYYDDLFIRRRKTEPKGVFVLRACIMILLLFFLVVYTIFLTIYVVNDDPVIQVSTRNVEEIPIPGMYI